MMFWQKHPDGCISRKLMKDWNEEEKALHARHGAMVKEACALGYVFSFDRDTLKWIGRFAPERPWVGLTDEEMVALCQDGFGIDPVLDGNLRKYAKAIEAKLKEKNA